MKKLKSSIDYGQDAIEQLSAQGLGLVLPDLSGVDTSVPGMPAIEGEQTAAGGGNVGRKPGKAAQKGRESYMAPAALKPVYEAAARKHGVPVDLLMAMGSVESGHNDQAVGPNTKWGAAGGIMQYLSGTAGNLGINRFNAAESIDAAAKQMAEQYKRNGGSWEDAVAHHHAGPDPKQWGPKTRDYVSKVTGRTGSIRDVYRQETAQQSAVREDARSKAAEAKRAEYYDDPKTAGFANPKAGQPAPALPALAAPRSATASEQAQLGVMAGMDGTPGKQTRRLLTPASPEGIAQVRAMMEQANPEQLQALMQSAGWQGNVARELWQQRQDIKGRGIGHLQHSEQAPVRTRQERIDGYIKSGYTQKQAEDLVGHDLAGRIDTLKAPPKADQRLSHAERAAARGISNLISTGTGLAALGADAVGADDLADDLLQSYMQEVAFAQRNLQSDVPTYKHVDSLGDAGKYAVDALLENAPLLLGTMGAGAVGGMAARKGAESLVSRMVASGMAKGLPQSVAEQRAAEWVLKAMAGGQAGGAIAASTGLSAGGIYGDIYQQTGEKAPGTAAVAGLLSGSLDAVAPLMALRKVAGPAVTDALGQHLLQRMGAEGAKEFIAEAGTEGLQTIIEQAAVRSVDGKAMWTAELADNVIDAMLKGGIAGGAMGALAGAGYQPKPQAQPGSAEYAQAVRQTFNNAAPAKPQGPIAKAVDKAAVMPELHDDDDLDRPPSDEEMYAASGEAMPDTPAGAAAGLPQWQAGNAYGDQSGQPQEVGRRENFAGDYPTPTPPDTGAIADTDARVAAADQQRAIQQRRQILADVLHDEQVQDKAGRFRAQLKRAGIRDVSLSADEAAVIERYNAARDAFAQVDPSKADQLPATPNDLESDDAQDWRKQRDAEIMPADDAPATAQRKTPEIAPSQPQGLPDDLKALADATEKPGIFTRKLRKSGYQIRNDDHERQLINQFKEYKANGTTATDTNTRDALAQAQPAGDTGRAERPAADDQSGRDADRGMDAGSGQRDNQAVAADGSAGKQPARVKPGKSWHAKAREVDLSRDSVRAAISRLGGIRKDEAMREWGATLVEGVRNPVWGKPVFRSKGGTGLSLDNAREALTELGYLPEGSDINDLYDAFESDRLHHAGEEARAQRLAAEQQPGTPATVEPAAQADLYDLPDLGGWDFETGERDELTAEIRHAAETAGVELSQESQQDVENLMLALHEEFGEAAETMLERAAIHAEGNDDLYYTKLKELINDEQARQEGQQVAGRTAEDHGAATGRTPEDRPDHDGDGQILESYDQAELDRREQAQREAETKRKAEEQAAERKRQADAEVNDFTLTGSDSMADQLAARGQGGLFDDAPHTAPNISQPAPNIADGKAGDGKSTVKDSLTADTAAPAKPLDLDNDRGQHRMSDIALIQSRADVEAHGIGQRGDMIKFPEGFGGSFDSEYGSYDRFDRNGDKTHILDFSAEGRYRVKEFKGDKTTERFGTFDKSNWLDNVVRIIRAETGQASTQAAKSKPDQETKPAQNAADYGANNKLVSRERADELRDRLKKKLSGSQLNSGIDPELLAIGTELAVFHIEAGARKFTDFVRAVSSHLDMQPSALRPYLRSWYNGARDMTEDMGGDVAGMDSPEAVREALAKMDAANIDDITKDINDAPTTSGSVEPDSSEPGTSSAGERAADGDESAATGRRAGEPSGSIAQERDAGGGDQRVPGTDDARSGKRSDQPVHQPDGRLGTAPGAAGRGGRSGSTATGGKRLPADAEGSGNPVSDAAGTANKRLAREKKQGRAPDEFIAGDIDNIRATLPALLPEQQDDVLKAEQRFAAPDGHGMMFTNGTGTGKTYSGGGIAKRFDLQGKSSILAVAPSQDILKGWQAAMKALGIEATVLSSTSENGGSGMVLTTYANLGANQTLAERQWDLVIADESHKLMQSEDGSVTSALSTLRAITHHPAALSAKARMILRDKISKMNTLAEDAKINRNSDNDQLWGLAARQQEEADALAREIEARTKELVAEYQQQPRSKVVFLSATPFSYHYTLDYANGYLFDYNEGQPEDSASGTGSRGYNSGDNRSRFFMQHLGYRMRYNKLTQPKAGVNSEVLERELHEKLRRDGSLSGRKLSVKADYDRKFVLVDSGIGQRIDEALKYLNDAKGEQDQRKYPALYEYTQKKFDYLSRMRLLEAIKAEHAVEHIREHQALGRKVVVFHDYNSGGGFSPFNYDSLYGVEPEDYDGDDEDMAAIAAEAKRQAAAANAMLADPQKRAEIRDQIAMLRQERPDILQIDFSKMRSPLVTLTEAFPNALVYNGTVPGKERARARELFNQDGSGFDLIIVQSAAGEAGISLHDTTGKHQRVLINLGMPVRPVTAIQQEGRIYRVGQVTDAVIRYLTTGTGWEDAAFASKIASRAGTAENLGMGNEARALRQSFIDAYSDADDYRAGDGDGKGGKELDSAQHSAMSPFERSKTYYYAQQKNAKRRDQREGKDYYATPEPIGFKMVELANLRPFERVLEPSAGHGAIARFFPENTARTLVEPSGTLAPRAAMAAPGAKLVNGDFESLHISNKYDAIVMNPPYGSGGSTAIAHVAKAAKHLRNGGRIVALIPRGGMADKRFDSWLYGDEADGMYLQADIALPGLAFENAGTGVQTRIVVLEKQMHPDDIAKLQPQINRDYSNAKDIAELFDRIEQLQLRDRVQPTVSEGMSLDEGDTVSIGGTDFDVLKGGLALRPKQKMGKEGFALAAGLAQEYIGHYNPNTRAFTFPSSEKRNQWAEAFDRGDEPKKTNGKAGPDPEQVKAATEATSNAAEALQALGMQEVEHITTKNKKLTGYIVDLPVNTIKDKVDKYAFKKGSGVFVRKEHAEKLLATMQGNAKSDSALPSGVSLSVAAPTVAMHFSTEAGQPYTGGLTVSSAIEVIKSVTHGWKQLPNIVTVPDFASLPEKVQKDCRRQGGHDRNVQGVYSSEDKTVYIVAENHEWARDLEATVFHEILGHYGLDMLLANEPGDVERKKLALYQEAGGRAGLFANAEKFGDDVKEAMARYSTALAKGDLSQATQAAVLFDELIAHVAEKRPSGWRQKLRLLHAQLRTLLRQLGFSRLSKLNDADIALLVHKISQVVINGSGRKVTDNGIEGLSTDDASQSLTTAQPMQAVDLAEVFNGSELAPWIAGLFNAGKLVLRDGLRLPEPYDKVRIQGMAADGRITMYAENIPSRNSVMAVLLHEVFHNHAEAMIGTPAWQKLIGELGQLRKHAERNPAGKAGKLWADALARVDTARVGNIPMTELKADEELGAYAIELAEKAPDTWQRWVDRLLGHIKDWVRRTFGVQLGRLTPAQLRAMAVAALKDGRVMPSPQGKAQSVGSVPDQIEVDGVMRPTLNENGKRIYATMDGVKNFWRWIDGADEQRLERSSEPSQDSGGVHQPAKRSTESERYLFDEQGRPRVFYHGTADSVESFELNHPNRKDNGWLGVGVYLTNDTAIAETYARQKTGQGYPNVMPLYAAIHNPILATIKTKRDLSKASKEGIARWTDAAIAAGYDGAILDFGNGAVEVVAFNPNAVKSAIGNNGDFDPTDPRINFSVTPEDEEAVSFKKGNFPDSDAKQAALNAGREAQRLAANSPSSARQSLREIGFKALPQALGFLHGDAIVEMYRDELPALQGMQRLIERQSGDRQIMQKEAGQVFEQWKALPAAAADKLADLMHEATIWQLHPDKAAPEGLSDKWKAKHARLAREWAALPAEAQAVYQDVRDLNDKRTEQMFEALENRINRLKGLSESQRDGMLQQLRAQFDKTLGEGPYFPLARFGDFLAIAKKFDDKGKVIERVVMSAETEAEQKAVAADLLQRGFDEVITKRRSELDKTDGMGSDVLQFAGYMIGKLDELEMSDEQRAGMLDDINQMLIDALPPASARKHFKHRKGVPGFSNDALRAFARSQNSMASHIANLRFQDQVESTLDKASEQSDASGNSNELAEVVKHFRLRMKTAREFQTAGWANSLATFGYASFLGFSISNALLNTLQLPMMTYPTLASRFGDIATSKAMSSATAKVGRAVLKRGGETVGDVRVLADLPDADRRILAAMEKRGLLDLTMSMDMTRAGGEVQTVASRPRSVLGKTFDAIPRATHWYVEHMGAFSHVTESANRQITALAAYELATKAGMSHGKAVDYVADVLNGTQFNYELYNKPLRLMNNAGRVVSLMLTFSIRAMTMIMRNSLKAMTKQGREARGMVARLWLATFVMAGVAGLPILPLAAAAGAAATRKVTGSRVAAVGGGVAAIGALEAVLSGALTDDDEPWDWETWRREQLNALLGKRGGEIADKGVLRGLADINVTERIGLGSLLYRDIERDHSRFSISKWLENLFLQTVGGAALGAVKDVARSADYAAQGQQWLAAEALLFKPQADVLKAIRLANEGVTVPAGGQRLKIGESSPWDVTVQALGFNPGTLAQQFERKQAARKAVSDMQARRGELLGAWVAAKQGGDAQAAQLAMSEIADFNRKQREAGRHELVIGERERRNKLRAGKRAVERALSGEFTSERYEKLAEEAAGTFEQD